MCHPLFTNSNVENEVVWRGPFLDYGRQRENIRWKNLASSKSEIFQSNKIGSFHNTAKRPPSVVHDNDGLSHLNRWIDCCVTHVTPSDGVVEGDGVKMVSLMNENDSFILHKNSHQICRHRRLSLSVPLSSAPPSRSLSCSLPGAGSSLPPQRRSWFLPPRRWFFSGSPAPVLVFSPLSLYSFHNPLFNNEDLRRFRRHASSGTSMHCITFFHLYLHCD